jgi:hypothetical protein
VLATDASPAPVVQAGGALDGTDLDDLRLTARSAEATHGPHHPETGRALAALAREARVAGRHDEAELAGRRALAILQTQPVPDRAALAALLEDLGGVYEATARHADADHALRRAAALAPDDRTA